MAMQQWGACKARSSRRPFPAIDDDADEGTALMLHGMASQGTPPLTLSATPATPRPPDACQSAVAKPVGSAQGGSEPRQPVQQRLGQQDSMGRAAQAAATAEIGVSAGAQDAQPRSKRQEASQPSPLMCNTKKSALDAPSPVSTPAAAASKPAGKRGPDTCPPTPDSHCGKRHKASLPQQFAAPHQAGGADTTTGAGLQEPMQLDEHPGRVVMQQKPPLAKPPSYVALEAAAAAVQDAMIAQSEAAQAGCPSSQQAVAVGAQGGAAAHAPGLSSHQHEPMLVEALADAEASQPLNLQLQDAVRALRSAQADFETEAAQALGREERVEKRLSKAEAAAQAVEAEHELKQVEADKAWARRWGAQVFSASLRQRLKRIKRKASTYRGLMANMRDLLSGLPPDVMGTPAPHSHSTAALPEPTAAATSASPLSAAMAMPPPAEAEIAAPPPSATAMASALPVGVEAATPGAGPKGGITGALSKAAAAAPLTPPPNQTAAAHTTPTPEIQAVPAAATPVARQEQVQEVQAAHLQAARVTGNAAAAAVNMYSTGGTAQQQAPAQQGGGCALGTGPGQAAPQEQWVWSLLEAAQALTPPAVKHTAGARELVSPHQDQQAPPAQAVQALPAPAPIATPSAEASPSVAAVAMHQVVSFFARVFGLVRARHSAGGRT